MTDFEMQSAHASEAIASLCGFKKYASMQSEMKKINNDIVVNVNFDAFENRSVALKYNRMSSEYLAFIFKEIDWPQKTWIQYKTNDKYKHNEWFFECEKRNIPFITIHKKRKYCTLAWDCISLSPDNEHHLVKEEGNNLVGILYKIFQLSADSNDKKSIFDASAFAGEITNLSETTARCLANEYFQLLTPWKTQN